MIDYLMSSFSIRKWRRSRRMDMHYSMRKQAIRHTPLTQSVFCPMIVVVTCNATAKQNRHNYNSNNCRLVLEKQLVSLIEGEKNV
jgi:hypothetical protein